MMLPKIIKKLFGKEDGFEERIRKVAYNVLVEYGMDKKRAKKLVKEGIKVVKPKKPIRIFGESGSESKR